MKKYNYVAFKEYLADLLVEMHNTENNKLMKELLNEFKTNKSLANLHSIVENFKSIVSPELIDTFISENQKLAKEINLKPLKESINTIELNPSEFDKALNTILFERKTATNLNTYLEAYATVKNTLTENYNNDLKNKEAVSRLTTLTESMDEDTLSLVTSILKTDMSSVLKEQINETIEVVNNLIKEETDVNKKLEYYKVKDSLYETTKEPNYESLSLIFELKKHLLS